MAVHTALKETDALEVVGGLLELELSAVLHELLEFRWVASAELLEGSLNLLLLNVVVFLVLGATWQSLPWELTLQKVEEHVPDGLQVVTS